MRFASRPLTRAVTLTATLGLAAVSLSSVAPSATSAVVLTNYGYSNSAWGTSVVGGSIPAGSGETAHIVTSCTRKAGLSKVNEVAGVNLGDQVKVNGVTSFSRTYKDSKGFHSESTSEIAKVVLGDNAAVIRGLTTTSHSWVDKAGKYHATSKIDGIIKIGPLPAIELPDPGSIPILIPGVGLITLGHSNSTVNATQAYNQRIALLVKVFGTGSTVKLGRAGSLIVGGVKEGVMGGSGYGSTANVANGTVTSGKTALLGVPCQGTNGKWLERDTAGVNIPGVARVGVTQSETMGDQTGRAGTAVSAARNSVAKVTLGDNQLIIKGIHSESRVTKSASGKVTTKAKFGILEITMPDGSTRELLPGRTIEIPGIAKLTAGVVKKSKYKISVIALLVEVLPGESSSVVVLKLGNSHASLVPQG
ncbi:choice-of-anchor P family protein [Nocardioides speluncae]|uniref:choice-of-anchor P family protein n=1 Tax=Nocardioides speluncae TaxID=2670337 RepID=UPI000D68B4FE|nr:choice-of-anchor P family protein [Nocardioides speluncae]